MNDEHLKKILKDNSLYDAAMEYMARIPCRIAQVIDPDTNKYFAASNINWFEITDQTQVIWTENAEDGLLLTDAKAAHLILKYLETVGQLPPRTGIQLVVSKIRSIILPPGITV